jgi:hypothetical protein
MRPPFIQKSRPYPAGLDASAAHGAFRRRHDGNRQAKRTGVEIQGRPHLRGKRANDRYT